MTAYLQIAPAHRRIFISSLIILGLYVISTPHTAHASTANDQPLRFWHWWYSTGEKQNITVLNKHLAKHNLTWQEPRAKHYTNSTAGYLDRFNAALKTYQSPDAAMMSSSNIKDYDKQYNLLYLDNIAKQQGWEDAIPEAIQNTARHNGHWVSAPINSHSTNWLWVNKALFSQLDMAEPQTWEQLLAVLDRAKALGIPQLAALNDNWEQSLLYELVAMSTGGLEFYRRVFINLELSESDQAILELSFTRLKQLTSYFAEGTERNAWHQNTALVAQGKLLMQIHGSWVNSELTSLGAEPDSDYLCMRFPDTQGAYLFHSDHVIFFDDAHNQTDQQKTFARILLDKEFQRELSIASGASPSRVDVSTEGFNSCSKKSIHDLRMANMRRAVMPSSNNSTVFNITMTYLKQKITAEQAAQQVLEALKTQRQQTLAARQ